MNNKNVRIKDIAQQAGVSVGTVDRVLHNRGRVSKKALDKIMGVLEKTGYKPNLLARTLGANKKYYIGALIPDPFQDEFWEHSNDGISDAQREWSQYNIEIDTFYYNLYDKNSYRKSAKKLLDSTPDAIITSPIFHHEALEWCELFNKAAIPCVFFNSNIPEINPLCFIGQDFYQSGRLGAELLNLSANEPGTFAILHIYEDIHNSVHLAQKEKGFKDYFLEKNTKNFKAIGVDYSNPKEPSLEEELTTLLADPKIKGFLVTTSKGLFITASYLDKHKRDDIRLVGYDLLRENIKYLEKGTIDFLIHQNPKRQAALGISYLANYLLFKKETPATDLFPLEVITRQNLKTFLGSSIHYQLKQ